ncbi:MAG: lipopolysaccharide kinase InaA family protein [Planctomycetota bacterium]
MERIVFTDSWQAFFADFGLKSFDDFFAFPDAKIINENNKRQVCILTLGDEPGGKVFFLKRFHNPHLKDILFALRNSGSLCSQAAYEWRNANALLENGIATYKPVCFGERTRFGLESKSFLATEKLQALPMTDFVRENWEKLSAEQKERIITDLGRFVRRIHDLNVSLPDLYLWHIFIKEDQSLQSREFAVIDLHRMRCNVTSRNQKVKNLGRFDHSMVDKYFDERLKRLFVESYAADNWDGDIAALVARVKKYSAKVSAKRNPKPY